MRNLNIAAAMTVAALMSQAVQAETTYIRAGSLLDTQTGRVARNAVIVVDDEMITAVGDSSTSIPDGATVIDLSDSFVLPGVMDMHTHVVGNLANNFFAGYFQSPHRATIGGVVNAEKTLMAGFTTIRNVGAGDYMDVAIRNAINAGEIPGPRMACLLYTSDAADE